MLTMITVMKSKRMEEMKLKSKMITVMCHLALRKCMKAIVSSSCHISFSTQRFTTIIVDPCRHASLKLLNSIP